MPVSRSDGSTTGKIVGYRLFQSFTVSSKDIAGVEELAGRLSELLNQGVAASASPLQYISTQLAEARLQALDAATRKIVLPSVRRHMRDGILVMITHDPHLAEMADTVVDFQHLQPAPCVSRDVTVV